ncbi:hypothetical protein M422DRAFT_29817 [Sphaerobolus stellatus SS14]|uniref:Uncharacterized protein n=1 Tax=Sphaerobolus stellatus (strain SS14) TaxID=990650 RepID=A0A0C9W3H0_SPHS4|nr:hypothetical protein M422DRAFT_29817 [Sphaerobolus stellatus SS14]
MDVQSHPPYNNPSTSYLTEDVEFKHPYTDEENQDSFKYPPQPRLEDIGLTDPQQSLRPAPTYEKRRPWYSRYLPTSMASRLYLLTVLLQTAVDVSIEADILIQFEDVPPDANQNNTIAQENLKRLPVYLGIFAMAHVFQFILAIDAVVFRNTLQFIFLVIFNGLILIYSGVQISEVRSIFPPNQKGIFSKVPINTLTTIIPIVIALAEVVYIALGWKIYTEFGWKVYKLLGADRRIKKMYAQYQLLESLLKFDVFFWLGFSVQFLGLVLNHSDFEFGLTIAALPLSMLLLLQGHLAARYENKWMMWSFLVGLVAGFAYFSYKLYTTLIRRSEEAFKPVVKSLSIFTIISMILLITTFVYAVFVMLNFERGLKVQLDKSKQNKKRRRTVIDVNGGLSISTHPHRMSIE